MDAWFALKRAVSIWSHLQHDALQILVPVLILVTLGLLLRRPITSLVPVATLCLIGLANEAADFLILYRGDPAALWSCGRDLLLFVGVPLLLAGVRLVAPRMLVGDFRPEDRIVVHIRPPYDGIVEAEFEEVREADAA